MGNLKKLESIHEQGLKVADGLRLGYEATASTLLIKFIDTFNELVVENKIIMNQNMATLISIMLEAQQRSDNLYLADILQYELLPLLVICDNNQL